MKSIKFTLAVLATLYLGYAVVNQGLAEAGMIMGVLSTIYFGWLAAFTRSPKGALPFLSAYPQRVYVAASLSLLSGAVILVCTKIGVFLIITMIASLSLIARWWMPHSKQRMGKSK